MEHFPTQGIKSTDAWFSGSRDQGFDSLLSVKFFSTGESLYGMYGLCISKGLFPVLSL